MSYKDKTVKKPWGHEYLIYENHLVAIWYLHIKKGERTSTHCHPNKNTGLMSLHGTAWVHFLSGMTELEAGDKTMIRSGVFHSTRAPIENLDLLEIETPPLKHDLVRMDDDYNRTGKPYEDRECEIEDDSTFWIDEGVPLMFCRHGFQTSRISDPVKKREDQVIMVLAGGLIAAEQHPDSPLITKPGDTLDGDIWNLLVDKFQVVHNTHILTIS